MKSTTVDYLSILFESSLTNDNGVNNHIKSKLTTALSSIEIAQISRMLALSLRSDHSIQVIKKSLKLIPSSA